VGAAVVTALAILAATVPIRFERVPESVGRIIATQWGASLTFGKAKLWLLPPKIEVDDACVWSQRLAAAQSPALAAQRLEIGINPLAWLLGIGKPVASLAISTPSPIRLYLTEHGVRFPEELNALIEHWRTQRKSTDSPGTGIWSLELRDANLALVETFGAELPLPVRPRGQVFETTATALHVQSLRLSAMSGQRYSLNCVGEISMRQEPSPFSVRGVVLNWNEFAGELYSPLFRGSWPMGFRGAASAEAKELRVDVRVFREDARLQCMADATIRALAVAIPQHNVAYQDENLSLSARASVNSSDLGFSLEQLSVKGPQIDLEIAGRGEWQGGLRYTAAINAEKLGAPYIELLNAPLPRGFDISAGAGMVRASVHVSGQRHQLESVVGQLTFSTVTLQTPHFRRPVRELSGELDFEPQRLVFHELSGKVGNTWLRLDGDLTGDYLTSHTGKLRLQWESRADARDALDILQTAKGHASGVIELPATMRGTILSSGQLEQAIVGEPANWPAPRITGKIAVRDMSFKHRSLPVAVTNIGGELQIENARVIINGLQARLGSNSLTLDGELVGDRYFWREPVLSATASLVMDAASLAELQPSSASGFSLNAYHPSGQVTIKAQCMVPFAQPEKSQVTGTVAMANGGLEFATDYVAMKIANLNATAAWNGKSLTIQSLSGQVNSLRIKASGSLDEEKIRVRLNGEGPLEDLQRCFPRMAPYAEIQGPASCDVTIEVTEPATRNPQGTALDPFVRLLADLPQRCQRAYEAGHVAANGQVVAGSATRGALFRHHAMPPARTLYYGLSVPRAEIADIHGTFLLRGTTIEVPDASPLRCAMSDTPQCRLSGKIEFIPGNYPRIVFRVETPEEAKLDTWLTGWSQDFHPPAKRTPPKKGKRFELDGTIVAAHATYKGEKVDETSARILYTYVAGEPPSRTDFRDVTVQGFGGKMQGSGMIETRRDMPDDYPRWEANVQLDHVRIAPLSRVVFRDPQLVEGMMTGRLQLQGVKTDSKRLSGKGRVQLIQVEVGRLPFILKLFQMVNLTQTRGFFEKAAYNSKQEAKFQIANGVITWDRVELETEGLLLELVGSYQLEDHTIDAQVRLNLFESSLLGAFPFVGELARLADRTLGKVIVAFRVSGPAARPTITPIPLPLFRNTP
jgi:hypothetical protein